MKTKQTKAQRIVELERKLKEAEAELEAELRTRDNAEATHRITLRGLQAALMRLQTKCDRLEAAIQNKQE